METIRLYKFSLMISLSVIILGAMFKIQHWPGASLLLSIGLIVGLIYMVIALVKVFKTSNKSVVEKLLWLIGFIFLPCIFGLVYYYVELKPKQNQL